MTQDQNQFVGAKVDPSMIGWSVYTLDGDRLGTVKELQGSYFKVDARMQPDYWLQAEVVQTAANDRLTMEFKKDELGDYKVSEPNLDIHKAPGFEAMEHPRGYAESPPPRR